MKHSFVYRALAKAQTLLIRKVMGMAAHSSFKNEDVHLLHYSHPQSEAEQLLEEKAPALDQSRSVRLLIVIPFRDKWSMTETCLQGILRQRRGSVEIQIALADNGSKEEATAEGIRRAQAEFAAAGITVKHFKYNVAFNFSYLNNQAVRDSEDFNADVLALVNNDIEFIDSDSLLKMVEASYLPKAGAVGCTLLYPNGLIQHLFVFVGSKIVGSHPYKGESPQMDAHWYQHPRAVGAVTGAVMFIQRANFEAVGGFDEELPTSYQDVDLCLKFQKVGLVNWVVPNVSMIHHETQTRSLEPSWNEADLMEKKWGDYLLNNPFVSSVWSRKSEHYVFTPRALFAHFLGK